MASYALMPIYSGFTFDMTKKQIGFAPIAGEGRYLFSVCDSWGTVTLDGKGCRISVLGNPLTLRSVSIPNGDEITRVSADGARVDFTIADGRIVLGEVEIHQELCLV